MRTNRLGCFFAEFKQNINVRNRRTNFVYKVKNSFTYSSLRNKH